MLTGTPESVTLVPIARVEILNSRERNMKIFEEIVENIKSIGLKKPITVTERPGDDGHPKYLLVCGEGRLNAFRILGETHIPALVVDVSDEDAFIMSLAENIARRGHRPLEILDDIELLLARDVATGRWKSWPTSKSCARGATTLTPSSIKPASHPSTSRTSSSCSTRAKNG